MYTEEDDLLASGFSIVGDDDAVDADDEEMEDDEIESEEDLLDMPLERDDI